MQQSFVPQNIQKIYEMIIGCGVALSVKEEGDQKLLIAAAQGGLTEELRALLKKYKPGLVAHIEGKAVNDFETSLEKGGNALYFEFLDAVYRRAFYNVDFIKRSRSGNTAAQKTGVDAVIYLTSDRIIRADEKLRYRNDYSDIALEYISSDRIQSPGWIEKDLGIDYLTYAFVNIKRAYLFPWQQLKVVWNKNKVQWLSFANDRRDGFCVVRAPNDTYHTLSCAIPTGLLLEEVKGAMVITI